MNQAKDPIYEIDGSSRRIPEFIDSDKKRYEIRFENAELAQVCDALNKIDENFVVVASTSVSQSGEVLASKTDDAKIAPKSVTGFFAGSFYEIVRDVSQTGGFSFDRIENTFYLADNPVDLSVCAVSSVVETNLLKEDLDLLKTSFGPDVDFSLVSSKCLITGRFYAVKRFREYVLQLNEVKRSYVARLVFVRLERSAISRIEAEIKASQLDLISNGYDLYSMFESQLDVKFMRDQSYNFQEQLIYCSDGQKSQLKIGSTFQRENRAVSDYGTSTTTGYQQFEDGVDVELTPYRSLNGVVELQIRFSNSKFSDASNLAKSQVDLTYERLTIQENRLYFVASLNETNASNSAKILGLANQNDGKVLTCWLVVSPVRSAIEKRYDDDF